MLLAHTQALFQWGQLDMPLSHQAVVSEEKSLGSPCHAICKMHELFSFWLPEAATGRPTPPAARRPLRRSFGSTKAMTRALHETPAGNTCRNNPGTYHGRGGRWGLPDRCHPEQPGPRKLRCSTVKLGSSKTPRKFWTPSPAPRNCY